MKRIFLLVFVLALVAILSSACGTVKVATKPVPGQLETVVASTMIALTAQAPISLPTYQPLDVPSPTATQGTPGLVFITTAVDNVNLRVGPGTLFKVSRVLPISTRLKLLGKAPGDEWLQVMNNENIIGWVHKDWVKAPQDGLLAPVVQPMGVYLVTGKVQDSSGLPIAGIGFSVTQGSNRVDALTDLTGQFYAYLPTTLAGTWAVSFVSVDCRSNTMDASCKCVMCGKPDPETTQVNLPQGNIMNFTWK